MADDFDNPPVITNDDIEASFPTGYGEERDVGSNYGNDGPATFDPSNFMPSEADAASWQDQGGSDWSSLFKTGINAAADLGKTAIDSANRKPASDKAASRDGNTGVVPPGIGNLKPQPTPTATTTPAPAGQQSAPLGTGAKVAIAVTVGAAVGGAVYLATKKRRRKS